MNIFNSYKSIIKEASLFSGVQIVLLLVALIRSMFIAKFLGVEAIGILGILQTTIVFFIALFSVGLPVLLVRSFALNEIIELEKQQYIIKKVIVILGFLGSILFYLFVPFFSDKLFNHANYSWILKAVAVVILFKQIAVIKTSELQGKQELNSLAKVNVISSILGLIISIPLYYYFKLQGVIYGFIIVYLIEALVSFFYKKDIEKFTATKINIIDFGLVLKKGVILGYGNVLTLLSQLLIIYYITKTAGTVNVGYYNAGFSIINNYVALLFVAMSTGYLPRIIKLLQVKQGLQEEIKKQLDFSLVVIGCLSLICIIFASIIINILFSNEFSIVIPFLRIAIFGVIFKTFSWCLGYLIIAKVDTKVLMFTGIIFNLLFSIALIFGFHLNGLNGVAYAFVIYNFMHFISVSLIVKFRYNIIVEIKTILLLISILLLNFLAYCLINY